MQYRHPSVYPKFYEHQNSATTGPIPSKYSSFQLSQPVDVQRLGLLPVEAFDLGPFLVKAAAAILS